MLTSHSTPALWNTSLSTLRIGWFCPEAGLITESAERENVLTIGASDDLAGQSILFASAQDPLIGEELYATGAYLGAGSAHEASLTVQDILRWIIILLLLGGAGARLATTLVGGV